MEKSEPKLNGKFWEWIEEGVLIRMPIIGGGFGGGDFPDPPPPTAEERELMQTQIDLARQQIEVGEQQLGFAETAFEQQRAFGAFLLGQQGFEFNEQGEIVEVEDSRVGEIRRLTEERQLAALRGELPVDPGLERNIVEAEEELRGQLAQQLGPGFETSSAGIEALSNLRQRAEEIRANVRRGEITTGEALRQSQAGALAQAGGAVIGAPTTAVGTLSAVQRGFAQAAGTFQLPLNVLGTQRERQFQTNLANAQLRQQRQANIAAGVGTAVGLGATAALAFCCPAGAMIDTPFGRVPIEDLSVGDPVQSMGDHEKIITVAISEIRKVPVSPGHVMRGLHLSDDSMTWLSKCHPLSDGRPIEALKEGDRYNGQVVIEIMEVRYDGEYTYDILPGSHTGTYWVDGVLVGSTLKQVVHS